MENLNPAFMLSDRIGKIESHKKEFTGFIIILATVCLPPLIFKINDANILIHITWVWVIREIRIVFFFSENNKRSWNKCCLVTDLLELR